MANEEISPAESVETIALCYRFNGDFIRFLNEGVKGAIAAYLSTFLVLRSETIHPTWKPPPSSGLEGRRVGAAD